MPYAYATGAALGRRAFNYPVYHSYTAVPEVEGTVFNPGELVELVAPVTNSQAYTCKAPTAASNLLMVGVVQDAVEEAAVAPVGFSLPTTLKRVYTVLTIGAISVPTAIALAKGVNPIYYDITNKKFTSVSNAAHLNLATRFNVEFPVNATVAIIAGGL